MKSNASLKIFILGFGLILLVSTLSLGSSWQWLNLKLHDYVLNLEISSQYQNNTLLIHSDFENLAKLETKLESLVDTLSNYQPRSVVLVTDSDFLLKQLDKMSLAFTIAYPIQQEQRNKLPKGTSSAFKLSQKDGIYRYFSRINNPPNFLSENEKNQLSVPVTSQNYLNYFIDINSIPNLTITQAIEGGIVDELVNNKIIIVAIDIDDNYPQYFLPSAGHREFASYGELQALATETFISNSLIWELPFASILAILLLIYIVNFAVLQLLTPQGMLIYAAASLLTILGIFTLALLQFQLLLPCVEILIVQFFTIPYFVLVKRFRDENTILTISSHVNARLNKRIQPKSFYETSEPWQDIHALINQQLDFKRSVFLEKIEDEHRVKEIHALNCSLNDIQERRRDFERMPYSGAIQKNSPMRLPAKSYFIATQTDEIEYLIPLIFSGSVLGFWALTIIPDELWNQQLFEKHLAVFSSEISELLFLRHQFRVNAQKEKNMLRRFMFLKLAQVEYEALDNSVALLEKRYAALIDVFDGMSTALTVYNLFGYIVYTNKRMESIATDLKLPIYSISAHDFLKSLTGLKSEKIKEQLIDVSIEGKSIDYQIINEQLSADFILRVRPINVAKQSEELKESPLMLLGVLFEFIDVTSQQKAIAQKKDLFGQYFHHASNQISSMNLLCRRLKTDLNNPENTNIKLMQEILQHTAQLNKKIENQIEKSRTLTTQVKPINPIALLKKNIKQIDKLLNDKNIQLNLTTPTMVSLVFAESEILGSIFDNILRILIDDCPDANGEINISIKDTKKIKEHRVIHLSMTNNGFGIPKQQIKKMQLNDNSALAQSKNLIEQLVYNSRKSAYWGLELSIDCEINEGFNFSLTLPTFAIEST